jgi:DNA-binding CsgD family transcriptional regulator
MESTADLLEREGDIELAERMLAAAAGGEGAALLIEGPAGIGKSALIRAIRGVAASRGCAVLAARGAELERDFSFGVVRQLFEPVLAGAAPAERERLLTGAAHLAEPAIGELDPAARPAPGAASPSLDPSFAVLHGLFWLTANLAERAPLVLAVDDAQWSDNASLRFLGYLAGRLEGLPAMLVVGMRRFEPDAPVDLLRALGAETSSATLRVAPLTAAGADTLVRGRLATAPSPGFSLACHRATGGNPQLIRELLAALSAEGVEPTPSGAQRIAELHADRIAASILARVGRVGPGALAVARAVAVLGREAELPPVAELAGLDVADAAREVDALVALEILAPGRPVGFVHPIVRTAVYNDFGSAERGEAHRRAAHLLFERGADLDSVAAQIVATPPTPDGWAVGLLGEASARALARGAPEAAVAYLEHALERGPDGPARREALLGLGRAFAMLRDRRRSIRHLREALELTADHRERAEIVHVLFAEISVSRAAARAIDMLDRELDALPESELELGTMLESDISFAGYFSLGAKRAGQGRRRRFDNPGDPRMLASAAMDAALYGGTADEAAALAMRADGLSALATEGPDAPMIWTAGYALLYAHHLAEARALADAWIVEAGRRGSLRAFSLGSSLRTRAAHWAGDLADAEADARAFIEGMPEALGLGPAFLADILLDRGEVDEAAAVLALAERAELEVEWSFFYPALLLSRGRLLVMSGDTAAGVDSLLAAGAAAGDWGADTPGAHQWRPPAAEALAALGEDQHARRLVQAELESCRRFGSPRALGIALRAAARLEHGGDAVARLQEAVELLARSPARLEHARALVELGSAMRRERRAAEARRPLREGLAAARSCGALALAERAHEELTATGARPRKIVRGGVEALTSSERRVARLAAEGMSNKEIAQSLFVTVRTVEAHLHHAYVKLEISSRAQLPAALAESHA